MFEVSGSSLSWAKRLNDTSLRWIGPDWLQSFKEKPKTQDHFEKSHGRIEPVRVNRFGEAGENEINEGTDHAPGRRDHTEEGQSFRDIVRFEPQPGANRGGQSKKWQADVVIVERGGDGYPGQGLQSVRLENLQITGATQKPERAQHVERAYEPH